MKYIWKLTKAEHTSQGYSLLSLFVTSDHFSSLKKCREIVKNAVKNCNMSINNWTEEIWNANKDYCTIINSGAEDIFSFKKIHVH